MKGGTEMKNNKEYFDTVIIGGGPAGLSAAISSAENGLNPLIVEREERLGGILKQCIHDGFGIITFNKRLSGPEYASRYVNKVEEMKIPACTKTFLIDVENHGDMFKLTLSNGTEGMFQVMSKTLILATGCRERTARQVFINGHRPAGIYTAGTAQYFTNIEGYLPCKKCVILGSGDIGLIMARRLTLEGAKVIGVYEAKSTPSGLSRNMVQCLEDFSIPLYLSHTVTKVFGEYRVEAVEICKVNEIMEPIAGTEEIIPCDGLILSVGLIPENEIPQKLGIPIDSKTNGPFVDQDFMTKMKGIFSCGNALHVNDLVDYVSESGKCTGQGAYNYINNFNKQENISLQYEEENFAYVVPQEINLLSKNKKITMYFRSKKIRTNVTVNFLVDGKVIITKKYINMRPPEMERLQLNIDELNLSNASKIKLIMINE